MNSASQITSQITAAASRKPRQRQAPSQRDQQIDLDYQTSGMRQNDLAEKYGLTQCRISQIIRRVEKWLYNLDHESAAGVPGFERSSNPVDDSEEFATDGATARQRLLHRLEFKRLNSVCRHALQHFQQQQKCITHKTGSRAGKPIDETTERTLPPSIQCLKVVLQANSQLSRLEKKRGAVDPPLRNCADDASIDPRQPAEQGRERVEDWLVDHRDDAERAGLAPCSFGSRPLIQDLINTLLGEPNKGVALIQLARECGKKVVDRKSYDDHPPKLPPDADGWYYPMYDYHGGLVAWLSADQFADAVHPDYLPVSRDSPNPADAIPAEHVPSDPRLDTASTTTSSTWPPSPDSPQPSSGPVLTVPVTPDSFAGGVSTQ